jgi:hypothetical protein
MVKEMASACSKYGKYVPSLYNTLVNVETDLKFIGARYGSSYFRNRNMSRTIMFQTVKQGSPYQFSLTGRANTGSNYC